MLCSLEKNNIKNVTVITQEVDTFYLVSLVKIIQNCQLDLIFILFT